MRELAVYWIICFIFVLHFYDVQKNGRLKISIVVSVFFLSFLLPFVIMYQAIKKIMKK